ncbi:MAG: ribbon-helix-helix domain-containing protein [Candidatus Bathyarchaeota archaeon]|nr:ribbon-helix-helix domain-containing protein [Candidatus Bathyarchaeota archaeon]
MKVTNVRLSEKIIADTDKLAKKYELNRSEVIRQALTVYLQLVENVGTMLRPIAFQVKPAQIAYTRRGDVSILKIPTGHALVVGSTSSGAVGPKALDKVKVKGRVLGKFLARVALMDVVATGAFPLLLSVTLGVEKEPTGEEILQGIKNEAIILGLEPNQVLMENTEENFTTEQTGAGLTVVGFANEEELRIGKTRPGDALVAIGKPKVGEEVIPAEVKGEIADLRSVSWLSQKKFIHDIVTVGTFGIAYEARMMAYAVGRQLKLADKSGLDMEKSAGPATVVLVTLDPQKLEDLKALLPKPTAVVGEIL